MRRYERSFITIVASISSMSVAFGAQSERGRIVGVVLDATGGVLPGVAITVVEEARASVSP